MDSMATTSHVPALAEPHARDRVGHEMQATLQELVDVADRQAWALPVDWMAGLGTPRAPSDTWRACRATDPRRLTVVLDRRRPVALARHVREAEGLSIAQIAARLGRSPATIKAYFYDPSDANKRPTDSPRANAVLGATHAEYGASRDTSADRSQSRTSSSGWTSAIGAQQQLEIGVLGVARFVRSESTIDAYARSSVVPAKRERSLLGRRGRPGATRPSTARPGSWRAYI